MSVTRTIAGVVAAPLVPTAIVIVVLLLAYDAYLENIPGLLLIGAIIGYPCTLLFGLPTHFLLMRQGWTRWWAYAVAGALIGAIYYSVVPTLLTALTDRNGVNGGYVVLSDGVLPVAMALCAIAGVVFWAVVRPDRSTA